MKKKEHPLPIFLYGMALILIVYFFRYLLKENNNAEPIP